MYKVHVKRTIFFLILGLIGGLVYALVAPKVYEGRAEIIVADQPGLRTGAAAYSDDVNALLAPSERQSVRTEVGILRTESIFMKSLAKTSIDLNDSKLSPQVDIDQADRLYNMYDAVVPPTDSELDPVRIVTIRAKAYNPEVAATLANNVLQVYNDSRQQSSKDAVGDTVTYLKAQIDETRNELMLADKKFRDYKRSHDVADIALQTQALAQQLEQLRNQREMAASGLAAVAAETADEKIQLQTMPKRVLDSVQHSKGPYLQTLESQVANLQALRTSKLNAYNAESPTVKRYDIAIAQARAELEKAQKSPLDTISNYHANPVYDQLNGLYHENVAKVQSFQQEVASLDQSLATSTARIAQTPNDELVLTQLGRERDIFDLKYRRAKATLEDIKDRINESPKAATVQSQAVPDSQHYTPSIAKFMFISALIGAVVGLLYSFTVESMKLPVHTSWQLSELTSLPIATIVPLMPRRMLNRHLDSIREASFRPTESFRFMASSMLAQENRPKTVLFTSVGGGVGCSSSAAQFAIALARTGVNVLLVDADLRNPRLTELFGMEGKVGVGDILGRTMLPSQSSELTQPTAHENLSFLPSGTEAPMSLADSATSHLQALIEELGDKAEVVVVDCPPCDVLSDAARLAQFVDKVFLVVSAKTTSFRAIPVAQDILTRAGAKEIDLVLTHASPNDEPFALRFSEMAHRA